MAQQKELNWLEFQEKFSSEQACRQGLSVQNAVGK